jgi:23S rRNA pseudouridine1911/1915/1917 synthase
MIHEVVIPIEYKGMRLDQALAKLLPQYSRTRLRSAMKEKKIKKCEGGEKITLEMLPEKAHEWQAEAISLPIVYEDDFLVVINKPVGMVVHPGAGNKSNTLANALLSYLPSLTHVPRAGIVHRLDKDTSGLLVVAKTLEAQMFLVSAIQKREIHREYYAIVNGVMISGGKVDLLMGRHPIQRKKMAVVLSGKQSISHYRVVERFSAHTLLKVILETGRTHQIRVHMAHIKHPLLGDSLYGARPILPKKASPALIEAIRSYKHQALHAKKLSFYHPIKKQTLVFEVPLPQEMTDLIELLRENAT